MYRPKTSSGPPDHSKLKLPKSLTAPTRPELDNILVQSRDMVREVEQMWNTPGSPKTFCLSCKFDHSTKKPIWLILEDDGTETKVVYQSDVTDLSMVHDVVCLLDAQSNPMTPQAAPPPPPVEFDNYGQPIVRTQAPQDQAMSPLGFQQPAQPQHSYPTMAKPMDGGGLDTFDLAARSAQQAAQPSNFSMPPVPQPADMDSFDLAAKAAQAASSPNAAPSSFSMPPQPQSAELDSFELAARAAQAAAPAANISMPPQPQSAELDTFELAARAASQATPTQAPAAPAVTAGGAAAVQASAGVPFEEMDTFAMAAAAAAAAATPKTVGEGATYVSTATPAQGQITIKEGTLEEIPSAQILQNLARQRATGKLEVKGEMSVANVFFADGLPIHASASGALGDTALKEVVTWLVGTYKFFPGESTDIRSVRKNLEKSIMEGVTLLDQRRNLEEAGLSYESYLLWKHKSLSDSEIKLLLMKGVDLDHDWQKGIYMYLKHKRTLTDLLRDKPMESATWIPLIFNLMTCGLIEIKAPEDVKGTALDFLEDEKPHVLAINTQFLRPETNIFTYPALVWFMQYEYFRYEAYGFPMSLIVFEMNKQRSAEQQGGTDMLAPHVAAIAAQRIELIKRPLDILGHFETLHYALLLPNTTAAQAAYIANRALQIITATPLAKGIDKNNLRLAFGISSIPTDGDDLHSLVVEAKAAMAKARDGIFNIVMAKSLKK